MKNLSIIFVRWLPIGVAVTGVCALVLVAVQQNYRASLNDPQIQLVEDAVVKLNNGAQPVDVVPRGTLIDADTSLAPFIAVYDKDGTPLEASATVGGKPPRPPIGVLAYARQHGQHRVSWQPSASTRIALVVMPVSNAQGWYVAAGRNMREVEAREMRLVLMTMVMLALILGATLVLTAVLV